MCTSRLSVELSTKLCWCLERLRCWGSRLGHPRDFWTAWLCRRKVLLMYTFTGMFPFFCVCSCLCVCVCFLLLTKSTQITQYIMDTRFYFWIDFWGGGAHPLWSSAHGWTVRRCYVIQIFNARNHTIFRENDFGLALRRGCFWRRALSKPPLLT